MTGKVESYCCNVICDAPTTSKVNGLRRDEMKVGFTCFHQTDALSLRAKREHLVYVLA